MNEEIKVRTGEQLEKEDYLLLYKSKAQIVNILIDAEEEIKRLKQKNKFLMKQDNILQTLMQWLYKEKEKVIKTYLEKNISCPTIKQANFITICDVIDKIKELKEEMK